ncbi:MAG: isoprenylcysteine carboxylmethyltransferase family protein [Candidatus Pacebacteria bacterium]|nr:isoprenylcysteine carboxylmethyltransferase family protein [Candidatus Paceibacterota bacterium]
MDLNIYLDIFIGAVSLISTIAIFTVVFLDFARFQKKDNIIREKKSIVDTVTMALFFLFYYLIIRFQIGVIEIDLSLWMETLIIVVGCLVIIYSCYVNVIGRRELGGNWANHIKIYDDHKLVTKGVYSLVRHPLYASLIWIFFGGSLVYMNYIAFILNVLIFIPFMYYRAKQEEELLSVRFKDYKEYKLKVGMFFPKINI